MFLDRQETQKIHERHGLPRHVLLPDHDRHRGGRAQAVPDRDGVLLPGRSGRPRRAVHPEQAEVPVHHVHRQERVGLHHDHVSARRHLVPVLPVQKEHEPVRLTTQS